MRIFYFFAILFMSMFMMVGIVIIQQPTPLKELPPTIQQQSIDWLSLDMEIHLSFLERPEDPIYAAPYINTGSHKFHQEWADNFDEIIKFIKREPCKYTKDECLELLGEAQSTHAGVVSRDYQVLQWNYDWFERYEIIMKYIETIK